MIDIDLMQTIALIMTIIAFIISQYYHWRQTNAQSFNRIDEVYSRIIAYRLSNPDILPIAKIWDKKCLDNAWATPVYAKYYSYGELCISFCNACLYHKKAKLISIKDFNAYYSGLMTLVYIENQPFFKTIIDKPYCSKMLRKWYKQMEKKKLT